MNIANLLIEGNDEALEMLLSSNKFEIESSWKKGDKRRFGVYSSSGINITISDAESPYQLILDLRNFINDCNDKNIKFSDYNLSPELSIGVTVGETKQFTASIELNNHDLQKLTALGVSLSISAYPTSDEANEKTV